VFLLTSDCLRYGYTLKNGEEQFSGVKMPGLARRQQFKKSCQPVTAVNRYLYSSGRTPSVLRPPTVELVLQDDTIVFPIEAVSCAKAGRKIPQASTGRLN